MAVSLAGWWWQMQARCVYTHIVFGVHTRVHFMILISAVFLQNFTPFLLTLSSVVSKEVVSTFAQTLSISGRALENVIYVSADLNLTMCPSQSFFCS